MATDCYYYYYYSYYYYYYYSYYYYHIYFFLAGNQNAKCKIHRLSVKPLISMDLLVLLSPS